MPEEDLVIQLINHPMVWVGVTGIIIFLIIREINRGKLAPETKPFWGMKVRKKITQDSFKDNLKAFGVKQKLLLKRGIDKVGIVSKTYHMNRKGNPKDKNIYVVQYRHFGFVNWLKAVIGKWEYLNIQSDVVTTNKKEMIIDPNYYMYNDSGIWTLANSTNKNYIDELNISKDHENVKGFVSDKNKIAFLFSEISSTPFNAAT